MSMSIALQKIALWSVPVLFAITVHEVAHGWVARLRGDPTAASMGRLTLNPIRHVDPVGTILVPAALLLAGHLFAGTTLMFGWAKPVPVDWRKLRNPRRDMALVAIAGPLANLAMGLCWALLIHLSVTFYEFAPDVFSPVIFAAVAGISINTVLMVLNVVPLPPLDGGRVATGLLPLGLARPLARAEPWGLVIIIALFATGALGAVIGPVLQPIMHAGAWLSGLPWDMFQILYARIT